jgi:DNA-binding NarL/FixJ family response regulator
LIKDLRAAHPALPVLVMSMHDEMIYAERALKAGARGYIMKEAPSRDLLNAIRTVLDGSVFASPAVTSQILKTLSGGRERGGAGFPLERLTDREMEVFELIGLGQGNREIAGRLGVSRRTIDAHRIHIREKLGIGDGGALTRYAVRWTEAGTLE